MNLDAGNSREIDRLVALLEEVFTDYVVSVVRTVNGALVRLTPKETGYASWWQPGIGGPPALATGRPTQERYPLPGDDLVDVEMVAYRLGDEVVIVSRAAYIWFLVFPNLPEWGSRQRPDGFVPDALDEAHAVMASYSFGGAG